ncbi:MAG: hypothetical protein LBQ24_04635 [Candidatus Peribacteria bacterium]|nr:hypothetical protein [Candidatus Peribacteria bacterium]
MKEKADINLQSTVKYYLNGNRDDNNYSRLSLLSIVPEKLDYYNIFWNNYKAQEIIDNNTLNTDLPKISEVSNGNLFLNLSSSSPLSYKIKLVKFDKTLYTNDNILVPLETLESADFLTST